MKHFLQQLLQTLLKFVDEIPPKDPYKKWRDRVKRIDQLPPEEKRQWYEEQDHMWSDYYDNLL